MSRRDPLGPEFTAAIDRMKAIAAESGDHLLLGDGPPHPDAKLLELCREGSASLQRAVQLWNAVGDGLLDDEHETLGHTYWDYGERLKDAAVALPASTLAGLAAKAEMLMWWWDDCACGEEAKAFFSEVIAVAQATSRPSGAEAQP